MKSKRRLLVMLCGLALLAMLIGPRSGRQDGAVVAKGPPGSGVLPGHDELQAALADVQSQGNGGIALNMWATIVDRDGIVRAVVFTGNDCGDQWPGSRAISAQKANTANAFCLPGLALSTANLYSAVQPGGSLFGLQHSNPVDTDAAYWGDARNFGQRNDPMVRRRIGGVNVFGGGLGLYNAEGELVGGIGVSGDSSCADHNIAWRVRHLLELDYVPGGVSPAGDDNIVFDISGGASAGGWGHPHCLPDNADREDAALADLPAFRSTE